MKVTYSGPFDAVRLPSGEKVVNGEPVDLDPEIAKALCKQDDWAPVAGSAKKATPRKTAATKKAKGTTTAADAAEAKEKP